MAIGFNLETLISAEMLGGLSQTDLKSSLQDAGQVIINSTHAGYLKQRGPGGEKWQANVPWYSEAKGGAATLTGPISKAVKGGVFAGWEFAKINPKRMRNALIAKVEGSEKVVIKYEPSVSERAAITQAGGPSKMGLINPAGKVFQIDLVLPPRPHLGVAENYFRLGGATDPEHINQIFGSLIDVKIA